MPELADSNPIMAKTNQKSTLGGLSRSDHPSPTKSKPYSPAIAVTVGCGSEGATVASRGSVRVASTPLTIS